LRFLRWRFFLCGCVEPPHAFASAQPPSLTAQETPRAGFCRMHRCKAPRHLRFSSGPTNSTFSEHHASFSRDSSLFTYRVVASHRVARTISQGSLLQCDTLCDCPTGKSSRFQIVACLAVLKKYSDFRKTQIRAIFVAVPSHLKGRLAIVTNAGRDAVDARRRQRRRRYPRGRPRRVVLTPRRWSQVCDKKRRRRWLASPDTGESTL
jgi:hypothetical protein